MKTEVRKRIEIRVPSGSVFDDFGADLGSQDPPKNREKSLKVGLASYLRRKPELERLRGSNFDVLGVIRERF